jgi:hypothetical protein
MFELSKWYGDCVTDAGDAVVIYHAELRLRAGIIRYSNLLTARHGEAPWCRYSLRRQPAPSVRADAVEWTSPEWDIEGRWTAMGRGPRQTLFADGSGSLEWDCIAARSAATVGAFRGWGYVEQLRMTIAPWRLPIRRLRWGRFVNATDALVWIDWSGDYNTRVVWHNGAAVAAGMIGESGIVLDDGAVLRLEPRAVLRDGTLGSTVLAALPLRRRLSLARCLGIRESKWVSRAVLCKPGHPESTGMAIHEVVEWP